MSQKDFAASIGISQASLSSIYNGRTLPTSRHVEAIHKRFPEISTNWLMFGEGEMLLSGASSSGAASTTPPGSVPANDGDRQQETVGLTVDAPTLTPGSRPLEEEVFKGMPVIREIVKYVDKPQRRIREIQVIYDDGILETFVQKPEQ